MALTSRDLKRVGEALRRLRLEAGITQETLGLRANLQPHYISGIETGTRNPTVRVLTQLLAALECSWERFGREVDGPRTK